MNGQNSTYFPGLTGMKTNPITNEVKIGQKDERWFVIVLATKFTQASIDYL